MLKINNVSKTYKGENKKALKNVSFNIKKGEFVALLGQNGAGKSTLINIIGGNVIKDEGLIRVGGYNLDENEIATKKFIGIVPQELTFDFAFNVKEVLKNQSNYFGIKDNDTYIDELLTNLHLADKKNTNNRELSGGMKRRLLIAKALVHKPELLILDEPTAGVDIELRQSLYTYLKQLHEDGTTIILTTHYLEEAEKLCDRIVIIDNGEMIIDDSKEKILNELGREVVLEFQLENNVNPDILKIFADYTLKVVDQKNLLINVSRENISKVIKKIHQENIRYTNLKITHEKLEDIYLRHVKRWE